MESKKGKKSRQNWHLQLKKKNGGVKNGGWPNEQDRRFCSDTDFTAKFKFSGLDEEQTIHVHSCVRRQEPSNRRISRLHSLKSYRVSVKIVRKSRI